MTELIGVDVCRRCGLSMADTAVDRSGDGPFHHVECVSHGDCYVKCMNQHPKDHYPEALWPAWERANAG